MSQGFIDVLMQHNSASDPKLLEETAKELEALSLLLSLILEGVSDSSARKEVLVRLSNNVLNSLPEVNGPRPLTPTPEILQWARNQVNEEEIVAGLCEIQQTGGLELRDFIAEIEQETMPHE